MRVIPAATMPSKPSVCLLGSMLYTHDSLDPFAFVSGNWVYELDDKSCEDYPAPLMDPPELLKYF